MGEAPIPFASDERRAAAIARVLRVAQPRVDDDACADATVMDPGADGDDAADNVGALDPRELNRRTPQLARSASACSKPDVPPSVVAPRTVGLYHAVRVLTSVLFTPHAATSISTSPAAGRGTGHSVWYSSRSSPPWPMRTAAHMRSGNAMLTPPGLPYAVRL